MYMFLCWSCMFMFVCNIETHSNSNILINNIELYCLNWYTERIVVCSVYTIAISYTHNKTWRYCSIVNLYEIHTIVKWRISYKSLTDCWRTLSGRLIYVKQNYKWNMLNIQIDFGNLLFPTLAVITFFVFK